MRSTFISLVIQTCRRIGSERRVAEADGEPRRPAAVRAPRTGWSSTGTGRTPAVPHTLPLQTTTSSRARTPPCQRTV
jgi:hypothetical protein